MKSLAIPILISFSILISCNTPTSKEDQKQSLAGKVYITSDTSEGNCKFSILPTDNWETFYFLNDSEYVATINDCCGGPGEDFAYAGYYKGIYSLDEKQLVLTGSPKCVIYYVKQDTFSIDSALPAQERYEVEKCVATKIRFEHLHCGTASYFKGLDQENKGDIFAPNADISWKEIDSLKANGVWNKLYK